MFCYKREIFVVCLFSVHADRQTFMSIKEMFLTSCLKTFREVCVCTTSSFEQITHLTFPVPVSGVECLCSISSIRSSWHHLTSFFNWEAEFRLSLNASYSYKKIICVYRGWTEGKLNNELVSNYKSSTFPLREASNKHDSPDSNR